jgi:hypothetical protein
MPVDFEVKPRFGVLFYLPLLLFSAFLIDSTMFLCVQPRHEILASRFIILVHFQIKIKKETSNKNLDLQ